MDTSTSSPSWDSLPLEIRLLILQYVVPEYGNLPTFAKAVRGSNAIRLNYIKRLRLHVRLAEYTDRIYDKPESATKIAENNRTFTCAISTLLNALSSWGGIRGGLTLEIDAHSPSDQIYHWKLFELLDDYPFRFEEDLDRSPGFLEYYRQKWAEARTNVIVRRDITVHHGMAQRLRGTPLELHSIRNLPDVPIVKGLFLRKRFYRGIALKSLARLCRESFVALESCRLERHIGRTKKAEKAFLKGLQTDLIPAFPASVERFSFAQSILWDSYNAKETNTIRGVMESPSLFLATSCHRFIGFSPPHDTNVLKFLGQLALDGTREGSRLQYLCLRTGMIYPTANQHWATDLLALAGRAALFLPRLRILEIWNSGIGYGYLFRYIQDDFQATITWRCAGTGFVLVPVVIEAWTRVASTRPLTVETVPFTAADGDGSVFEESAIIRYLALKGLVFDPIAEARIAARKLARRGE
ncbi:hypothetical protein B0J13DRAFT_494412 [Dactylonectria estremocensis]|uniref:DUF6546 domain-containing protein n=1 Tax=Dactylonectria estremocensis TaxID=1079267 RepID=A0A9P9FC81_9HYPO|nr:hypothetical protein B0J13DRAFT_494412 [Dactylonectria estremocensis]